MVLDPRSARSGRAWASPIATAGQRLGSELSRVARPAPDPAFRDRELRGAPSRLLLSELFGHECSRFVAGRELTRLVGPGCCGKWAPAVDRATKAALRPRVPSAWPVHDHGDAGETERAVEKVEAVGAATR